MTDQPVSGGATLGGFGWRKACGSFDALRADVDKRLPTWYEAVDQVSPSHPLHQQLASLDETQQSQLIRTFVGSQFAADYCCRHPDFFAALLKDIPTAQPLSPPEISPELIASFTETQSPSAQDPLADYIAAVRHETMVRIIWRDLNRLCITEDTTSALSALAETLIQLSSQVLYKRLCDQHGTPRNAEGDPQHLIVIGMGKLGAWELNLSSDIDLIFAYPERGQTDGAKPIANESFFTQLGQSLIRTLEHQGAFRVDMRLRPYGQSGALASSFASLENYYQTQGRPWERFAMVKARVVATSATTSAARNEAPTASDITKPLRSLLREFTYRRYLDFSAVEALRTLKVQIQREVQRKGLHNNIKLGRGGIREIEFIAQSFQVIRGGRERSLRERRVLLVLPMLEALRYLPDGASQALCDAYRFLRNLEHGLQAFKDQQTHVLPDCDHERERLAWLQGFDSVSAFSNHLAHHRHTVEAHFQAVITDNTSDASPKEQAVPAGLTNVWLAITQKHASAHTNEWEELGFDDTAFEALQTLAASTAVLRMDALGRERFDALLPRLLDMVRQTASPSQTLSRICPLLRAIARRSAYLVLLLEHPAALAQLVKLSEASPWIADRLADFPALLDELLDTRTLYSISERASLANELEQELRQDTLRLPVEDLEAQMEALRYFKSAHSLRVAACEVTERLPLMKVSDYLSTLAEVMLAYVVRLAWQEMCAKHGPPSHCTDDQPDLLVVGYGKLGGLELSHQSDLDLVFVHSADPLGESVGPKPLDHATYYARLGQKIIHILSTRMGSGRLYEVDMRLRPSGASGPLVSTMTAFEKYQRNNAWTWEHQALVRARAVYGPSTLVEQFDALRHSILCMARDEAALREDVKQMREKMRKHLGTKKQASKPAIFDLKQDAGGIVDIEFMVQYMVLNWAHSCPALTRYSDNIRILSCIEASGKLTAQQVGQLTEAYKAFRSCGHTLALQQHPAVVYDNALQNQRRAVISIWETLFPKA